ncbi:MAG TPA: transglutaminase-like domain-containing protein [Microthrixaceae bacterium]|nr:transglutaminase-like domain-containing protein [Microthrixaceae bacterium]
MERDLDGDPTDRFAALVARGGEPLDRLALAIAAHAHRDLDEDAELARIDELAGSVPDEAATLCAALFGPGRFEGDRSTYYDPDNSMLDRVLDRRRGIPITLSVLAIEVGRRVGAPLVGIGMPGHFLVRERGDATAYYDPFAGGVPLDLRGCEERFAQLHPAGAFTEAMLTPVGPLQIASRMLANLSHAYLGETDVANLVWVLRLRSMLPDATVEMRRQLAGVLASSGRFWEAAEEYDLLAQYQPDRADHHRGTADRLRARLN